MIIGFLNKIILFKRFLWLLRHNVFNNILLQINFVGLIFRTKVFLEMLYNITVHCFIVYFLITLYRFEFIRYTRLINYIRPKYV